MAKARWVFAQDQRLQEYQVGVVISRAVWGDDTVNGVVTTLSMVW